MSLDESIKQLFAGQITQAAFLARLGEAKLAVPLVATDDSAGALWVFEWNGQPHAAVFSDPRYVESLGQVGQFSVQTGRQLAQTWPQELLLALNPGIDGLGMVLPPNDFRSILNIKPQSGGALMVGAPAKTTDPVVLAAAKNVKAAVSGIDRTYVFQVATKDGWSSLAIGLVIANHAGAADVLRAAGDWLAGALAEAEHVEVLRLDENLLAAVSQHVSPVGAH